MSFIMYFKYSYVLQHIFLIVKSILFIKDMINYLAINKDIICSIILTPY